MKINLKYAKKFISQSDYDHFEKEAVKAQEILHEGSGKGNDFLGWLNLPEQISEELLADIENKAKELRSRIDVMVTIGIGGSYLGAKAVIEALKGSFADFNSDNPQMLFAGHNISEDYMVELRNYLKDKSYALTVISKSGTTTEPALAFRFLRAELEKKYGKKEASERIIAVTDKERGALKKLADAESYKSYVIPDDVGGRFSVLTPVGLFPIAIAGFDIRALVFGAKQMQKQLEQNDNNNIAVCYAAARNALYVKGFTTEILVNYRPKLQYLSEWWKQLYGESEGKDGKGIFPASVNFSTDLHSLGQYIQDGKRNLFETLLSVDETKHKLIIPEDADNADNLNYLAGKRIDYVNKNAELGTLLAHNDGGVPNIILQINRIDEHRVGELIYFFEKACGISGYVLGVNPFDQPGVEAYKRNMFALLEKPGFEGEREKLLEKQ